MSSYYNNLPSSRHDSAAESGSYSLANTPSAQSSSSPDLRGNMMSEQSSQNGGMYYGGFPEHVIEYQPPKTSRNRRKSAPGPDHIKHRRTRSGCLTCRGRRVKCDEARPICERCRKGKRDCVYPEPSPTHKSASSQDSKRTARSEEDDDTDDSSLTPVPDEEGIVPVYAAQHPKQSKQGLRRINTLSSLNLKRLVTRTRQTSETPSIDDLQSPSPIVSSTSITSTPTSASISDVLGANEPDWSHLPSDFRAGLDYFRDNVTHWDYGVHKDFGNFYHTTYINLALRSEALLNAIVGFSTYHRMLQDPNGRIEDFLRYYNSAVTLLIALLKKRDAKHDLTTLLTIFQLATLEEYLGDWMNLMGHQKAALEIFTQLFTADTMAQTSLGRLLLVWYIRFDMFVASMGGIEPSLPRHWVENFGAQIQAHLLHNPLSVEWVCENAENQLRLLCMDMCYLVALRKSGRINDWEFEAGHRKLSYELRDWRRNIDPILTDPSRMFNPPKQTEQTRLFHYYPTAAPLYDGHLTFTTATLTEWHSLALMHMTSIEGENLANTSAVLGDRSQHAEAICQIIETTEHWTTAPSGLITMLHPSLAIAAIFLSHTPRRNVWLREKFSWLENHGYIFAAPFRARMVQLFEDDSVMRWWLPNNRGFTPILQSVRAFADDRNASDGTRQPEHSKVMEDVFDAIVDLAIAKRSRSRGG